MVFNDFLINVGFKFAPNWFMLAHIGSRLAQGGIDWPKLVSSEPQVGSNLAPCWFMLAPNWSHDGLSSKVSLKLAKASSKAVLLRLGFPKMSTNNDKRRTTNDERRATNDRRRTTNDERVPKASQGVPKAFPQRPLRLCLQGLRFPKCPRRLCL